MSIVIQTTYNGQRFRSRLEARWAMFFTLIGAKYYYEFEAFNLPHGPYLPDFWLPDVRGGLWVEIKPVSPSEHESALANDLCEATKKDVAIAFGTPLDALNGDRGDASHIFWYSESCEDKRYSENDGERCFWDNCYKFIKCSRCNRVGFTFDGEIDRLEEPCILHRDHEWHQGGLDLAPLALQASNHRFWEPARPIR